MVYITAVSFTPTVDVDSTDKVVRSWMYSYDPGKWPSALRQSGVFDKDYVTHLGIVAGPLPLCPGLHCSEITGSP